MTEKATGGTNDRGHRTAKPIISLVMRIFERYNFLFYKTSRKLFTALFYSLGLGLDLGESGATTNHVEFEWQKFKMENKKKRYGRGRTFFESYFSGYVWRK
jgi:hypothetical protein